MEKATKAEAVFQTSDLFLVAYLFLKGYSLIRPPHLKKTLIVYTFERTSKLEEACQNFVNRSDLVEPLSLLERYRTLKAQAWEAKKRVKGHGEIEIGGGGNE